MILPASAQDYTNELGKLAPPGLCFNANAGGVWQKLLTALAQELKRADGLLQDLQDEAFPNTAVDLLSDWERVCGIPNACSTLANTTSGRQAAVWAQIRSRGGQSANYFESVYAAYGYTVMVENADTFTAGGGLAGGLVFDSAWDFYFVVNVYSPVDNQANFECIINTLKPAHTVVLFSYV